MAYLDVDALFTSIPLGKTIDIAANELSEDQTEINKLTKSDVTEDLNLATIESLFLFDNEYYYQTDGGSYRLSIGS